MFPDIWVILEKFYTCVYSSEEENEYESIKTNGNDKRNFWCPHLTVAFQMLQNVGQFNFSTSRNQETCQSYKSGGLKCVPIEVITA